MRLVDEKHCCGLIIIKESVTHSIMTRQQYWGHIFRILNWDNSCEASMQVSWPCPRLFLRVLNPHWTTELLQFLQKHILHRLSRPVRRQFNAGTDKCWFFCEANKLSCPFNKAEFPITSRCGWSCDMSTLKTCNPDITQVG